MGAPAKATERAKRKKASLETTARENWNVEVLEALRAARPEEAAPARALAAGDKVRVRGLSTPGTVIAVLGEEVEVEVGRLRMRVHPSELGRVEATDGRAAAGTASSRFESHEVAPLSEPLTSEINVIGTTAEEARERVDKFLDEAYLAGRLRLRVIHGHGKGILKKALHEMFATHPHVEKFFPAPPREGGPGATIVELKA